MPTPLTVLAIDPGRAKCGLAAVASDGVVLHRSVVPVAELVGCVADLVRTMRPAVVVVGDGTGTSLVCDGVRSLDLAIPVVRVDESRTSEKARARCLADTPPRGWQRLLPRSLRCPRGPYDDYVAVILAERWLASQPDAPSGNRG